MAIQFDSRFNILSFGLVLISYLTAGESLHAASAEGKWNLLESYEDFIGTWQGMLGSTGLRIVFRIDKDHRGSFSGVMNSPRHFLSVNQSRIKSRCLRIPDLEFAE